uniref:P17/29C-like protein DDB_G0287399 n=1 Tax=Caenorhabditis tropicalis TaxID=1561998 RepID=A0A1I7UAW8_9PELO
MGAKCCAPSSCKVRQRLLDEYESHEVYVPSRSASQDPDVALSRRRDSTVRVSVRSEGAANGQMKASNSTAGVSLTLPRVKNHTIRSTDTVPIVRVDRPPSRVETSHVVTGSLTRQLNDVSGKSVVRDSKSGQTMAANRSGSQPPGKVTYQYKVNASERRVEYRYQSETLLYDFEQTTKREQLETWESKKRVPSSNGTAIVTMVRKTKSLQEQDDILAKKRPEKSSKKPGNPNNH